MSQFSIKNRKASFEYHFLEKYVAGMVLTGTEIKSLREGKASINEAYCYITRRDEVFIKGMHIAEYKQGSYNNHEPWRERKLLLNKKELAKIKTKVANKGNTIVPTKVFQSSSGYAKIEIAVATGKKMHDKRDSIKERDAKREMDRIKKVSR